MVLESFHLSSVYRIYRKTRLRNDPFLGNFASSYRYSETNFEGSADVEVSAVLHVIAPKISKSFFYDLK